MGHLLKQACIAFGLLLIVTMSGLMVGARLQGYTLLSVQTGSMVPALEKGTLIAVTRVPSDKLAVGDIVTFMSPKDTNVTITHRIVELPNRTNNFKFLTKGDANAVHDVPIPASAILGKVDHAVPFAGYATDFIRRPLGLALIVYLPALWIIGGELRRLAHYYKIELLHYVMPGYQRRLNGAGWSSGGQLMAFVVVGVAVAGFAVLPGYAQVSASVYLTGTTIRTAPIIQPTPPSTCTSNTDLNVTNSSSQTAASGSASVTNNTNDGAAISGGAQNTNSSAISVSVSGC